MSGCLITKTGKIIECKAGQTHNTVCWDVLNTLLSDFLKSGGIRVKVYIDEAAIEGFDFPTPKQRYKINTILRINDIFKLITSFRGQWDVKTSFNRPIRRIKNVS
ncbi:hypothetical protein LCGC14_0360460 [marine sediment metagenome]|uniref:Uncharacterized protein n=1 Tax=marine sediment metagenome TaxID=412755 RepID=A0A0F9TRB7_9ZZZZ|nr:hypothetical protein [bacterium]